jgi:hypothetical protein
MLPFPKWFIIKHIFFTTSSFVTDVVKTFKALKPADEVLKASIRVSICVVIQKHLLYICINYNTDADNGSKLV